MLSTKTAARSLAALVVASLAAIALTATASGADATTTIRIWADKDRVAAVTKVANAWAASKGTAIEVVQKDFGQIRDNLKTVQSETAPDVIVGAHDWIGELSANGSIAPLFPSTATRKQFPGYALDAFSYGTAIKKLYGAPVALENIALVTNTKLAKVPATWAQLQSSALAAKKKTKAAVGISVQQGSAGDAYHMYPLFAGLGGYIFGKNAAGNLDPSNIGVANPKFLKNAALIDQWNKLGLIRSSVDSSISQDLFLKGKTAFWFTGPWNLDTLKKSGLSFRISAFPPIVKGTKAVPFLGVQGFMVTKFAATHNVESLAKDLVSNYMMQAGPQLELALANTRYPANLNAGKQVKDVQLKAFGLASTGGVPMPNIPQMNSVWGDLGAAWVRSTKGSGSVPARRSFLGASRSIAQKIG
jgi:arabinogalactan oligomer / maltooligosaccharide transport system substrate-binding protein